jgi:hypothetical protein
MGVWGGGGDVLTDETILVDLCNYEFVYNPSVFLPALLVLVTFHALLVKQQRRNLLFKFPKVD